MKKRTRGLSKKRGGMKKRRKKKKKKVEFLPFMNKVPTYEDPDIVSPSVELIITLVGNLCKEHFGKFFPYDFC
jgi:hypothetical protein